ncbi:hypothetical protein GJ496_006325 [Pomphorhynchus laevis]|nr:hypothetical protein GJ496_006325 [Pomphorhynchus laevis]
MLKALRHNMQYGDYIRTLRSRIGFGLAKAASMTIREARSPEERETSLRAPCSKLLDDDSVEFIHQSTGCITTDVSLHYSLKPCNFLFECRSDDLRSLNLNIIFSYSH